MKSTLTGRRIGFAIALASAGVVIFFASLATAQEATRALVNMIVAEQFCGVNAPTDLASFIANNAMRETGLSGDQLTQAGYSAAGEIGRAYANDGSLGVFCQSMVKAMYGRIQ